MGRCVAALTGIAMTAALFSVGGCQPLYGKKAERLHRPEKKRRPKDKADEKSEVKYVDDCSANFRGDPKRVFRDSATSERLVQAGDDAMAQAGKVTDAKGQAQTIKVGIEKYRNALLKDPYNAEATLKLALAYDRVLRKGCALKLLARIATLESHPKFRNQAKRAADRVADSGEWFKGYRSEAVSAVGR